MNYYKVIYDVIEPIAGTEVYPMDAYQGQDTPYVIIEVTDMTPIDGKKSATQSDEVNFTIIVYHDNADECQTIARRIRGTLDKFCNDSFQSCQLEAQTFQFDSISRAYVQYTSFYSRMKLAPYLVDYNALHYNAQHYST